MKEHQDPNNTQIVLPIICPNCSNELNLAMMFALLGADALQTPPPHEPEKA